jgi:ribosomal protein S11
LASFPSVNNPEKSHNKTTKYKEKNHMIASLNQFQNEVMQDSALQEQFKTVAATSPENLFTTSEVEQALAAQNAATKTGELSDEQLEVVAGGCGPGTQNYLKALIARFNTRKP